MGAEMGWGGARASEGEARQGAQQQSIRAVRDEAGLLTERVEELAARAESRATQIRDAELRVEALRASASEAGESLLRLHGEQKQAEEALVHQDAALHKLETNETELLEASIKVRDDAERAA